MSEGMTLSMDLWRAHRPGDDTVVQRCTGPTLDVGCGPGRMAHAVALAGVPALGIDISRRAVAEARARGAAALHRDLFGDLPAAGRWHHVLLLDGNVGIAADPVSLLRRCRDSMRPDGTVILEIEAPGITIERTSLRLVIDGRVTRRFPWARVGIDAVADLATAAGLEIDHTWSRHNRWFATLRRRA